MGHAAERRSDPGAALGADPVHLDAVRGDREAVLRGAALQPVLELAVAQLDDPVALVAYEVVVVPVAAEAVAGVARVMHERVDDAVIAEKRERSVHGRQADTLAPRAQASVDLLRGRVVGLGG